MGIFDIFKRKKDSNNEVPSKTPITEVSPEASALAAEALREALMSPQERELDRSMRKHTIMALALVPNNVIFRFYKDYDKIAWGFKDRKLIITDNKYKIQASAFLWLLTKRNDAVTFCKIMDILVDNMVEIWGEPDVDYDANQLIEMIRYSIPSFSIGNEPNSIRRELQWAYIDLQAIERFIHLFDSHMKTKTVEEVKNPTPFVGEFNTVADLLDACFYDILRKGLQI